MVVDQHDADVPLLRLRDVECLRHLQAGRPVLASRRREV
jgi:hypothetical protein